MLFKIFLEFCKIGVITFGGGNAVIPILHKELIENLGWISEKDFLYMVSVAESTPGPVGMNLATFIGFKLASFTGAIIATLGYVFIPFLIALIAIITHFKIKENRIYKNFLSSIFIVVIALLIRAVFIIAKGGLNNFKFYAISIIAFIIFTKFSKLNPVYLLLICGIAGIIIF